MTSPKTLLLIGVHREELAFGQSIADAVDPARVAVLAIPEGLSGRRPLPDEEFRYDTLHRALYSQILRHMSHGAHRVLIDLHTGSDPLGPSADILCADAALRARITQALAADASLSCERVRVVPIGGSAATHARTVIPRTLWAGTDFHYLGLEIYLPESSSGREVARELAGRLVALLVAQAEACLRDTA